MAAEDREYRMLSAEETLILEATEEISRVVEEWPGGMTRRELGERAGISKAHVVRFLQGRGNPKLRTLADLADAVDHRVVISLEPISGGGDE